MRRFVKPKPVSEAELNKWRSAQPDKYVPDDPGFDAQNKFVHDEARYLAAQCSRRAGKSTGLAKRFFRTMLKHPKSTCIYLALTRESAQSIMWPVLHELNDKYKLGCIFTDSKLEVKHPNGAKLKLYGADMKNFIKRLKGQKSPGIGIDEAQDFGTHLQSLIDDVLTPMLVDYEGSWLAVTGTPGPVPMGYFFEITQEKKFGYSHHEWTLNENPYIPNPQEFVEDLKKKREWDDNNPTYLREWRNKWVLDVESLWIQYKEKVNDYDKLPPLPGNSKYNYIMGIDWGFKDADAVCILAYSDFNKNTYLVEEIVTARQGVTELVNQIEGLRKKYPDISKIVMDEGGGGKKMAEEMRRRHAIPVEPAEKTRKQETVEFLNDAMRVGIFKAPKDSRFAKDSYLVQIDWDRSTQDKIVVKKQPHSDIIDAVIYAFKESPAFAWEKGPKPQPKPGTKEWADQQQKEMWDKALTHFQEQQDRERKMWGDWED